MHRFPRLHEALDYAADAHNGQLRKGTEIPYLGHLLGVCSLVLDYGGDEDQAIAGLLHDVVEDCGEQHLAVIAERFGTRVASIVEACTDGAADASGVKAPWKQRKEAHLAHLGEAPAGTILVAACDKLHNCRSVVADLRTIGPAVFERFKAGRDGTIWYYQSLLAIISRRLGPNHPIVAELTAAVALMSAAPVGP